MSAKDSCSLLSKRISLNSLKKLNFLIPVSCRWSEIDSREIILRMRVEKRLMQSLSMFLQLDKFNSSFFREIN